MDPKTITVRLRLQKGHRTTRTGSRRAQDQLAACLGDSNADTVEARVSMPLCYLRRQGAFNALNKICEAGPSTPTVRNIQSRLQRFMLKLAATKMLHSTVSVDPIALRRTGLGWYDAHQTARKLREHGHRVQIFELRTWDYPDEQTQQFVSHWAVSSSKDDVEMEAERPMHARETLKE